MEPFLNSGGAFRPPQIVKVGALSAPTQDSRICFTFIHIHM